MEYNKHQIAKLNDKKLLHKVKKRWVIISVALLGVIGGASAGRAHADVRTPVNTPETGQAIKSGAPQAALVSSASAKPLAQASSSTVSSSRQFSQQAHHLYTHILTNAMFGQKTSTSSTSALNASGSASAETGGQETASAPRIQFSKWGHAKIKFVSDGQHGNGAGDLAEVGPGAISDAFNEQNDSDTTYASDQQGRGCYLVNRYSDDLKLPFDQNSRNWRLEFTPGTYLGADDGVSKGDQTPSSGENPDSVDYEANAKQTNDYRNLFSSVNRPFWNHFKSMNLTNLSTNQATNLSGLFADDRSLQEIVLNSDANSDVSDIHGMFAGDPQLKEIDFKHFNTSHVTNMGSLFASDVGLRHLDVSSLDTSRVTNMHAMFMSDLSLSDLQGLNHLDMSNVTNVISMFARDRSLRQLALTAWNTRQVKSMAGMFSGDSQLRDLNLSGLRTDNVSDMSGMFSQDNRLSKLNLASFNTRKVQAIFPGATFGGMSFMFAGDDHLHELVLGPLTDLNRANQDWNSRFFDQSYDVNGNDATSAIKQGRQSSGRYYSSGYYNNVFLYRQYFADEQALVNQLLDDPLTPAVRSQVEKNAGQVDQLASSADVKLTANKVDPQVANAFQTITDVVSSSRSQASQAAQDLMAARLADASIASYYRSSVAVMNSRTASRAAQSADQSIVDYYQDSVSASVSAANQSIANSYQDSVKRSVSAFNSRTASAAAQVADDKIANSVSASVSNANSQAAYSAAQSADRSLASYYRTSVSNSIAVLNHEKVSAAAHSADEAIRASEVSQSNAIQASLHASREAKGQSAQFNQPGSSPSSFNHQPVSQSSDQSHSTSSLANNEVSDSASDTYRSVNSDDHSASNQSVNRKSSQSAINKTSFGSVRNTASSASSQRKSGMKSASSRSTDISSNKSVLKSRPSSNVYHGHSVSKYSDQGGYSASVSHNRIAASSGRGDHPLSVNHESGLNQHRIINKSTHQRIAERLPQTNESVSWDKRIAAILLALSLDISSLSVWLKKRHYNCNF